MTERNEQLGAPQGEKQSDQEALVTRIREIQTDAGSYIRFRYGVLLRKGLQDVLEDTGILPVAVNPNPFDAEQEELQHEKWWDEHPKEGEQFSGLVEKREEAIGLLHLGSQLRPLTKGRLYRSRIPLVELTRDNLLEFFKQVYGFPAPFIESALDSAGLVAPLEASGVLPPSQWQHKEDFDEDQQRRRWETLHYLHVGVIIDRYVEALRD